MTGDYAPEVLLAAAAIAAVAGVIRGVTGFGGAMVMSPPLALLLGPLATVPIVLLLESVAAAPMLVETRRLVRWRVVGPIIAAACVAAPLGTWLLLSADPLVMRRVIAAVVIVFSLALLRGWRYAGAQRPGTAAGVGAMAGALAGATSMSGPPVILYLMAGPDPIAVTRANLTWFICAISLAVVAMLVLSGAAGLTALALAVAFTPGYYGGMIAGSRLFRRLDEVRFRRLTLWLMLGVSTLILLA